MTNRIRIDGGKPGTIAQLAHGQRLRGLVVDPDGAATAIKSGGHTISATEEKIGIDFTAMNAGTIGTTGDASIAATLVVKSTVENSVLAFESGGTANEFVTLVDGVWEPVFVGERLKASKTTPMPFFLKSASGAAKLEFRFNTV